MPLTEIRAHLDALFVSIQNNEDVAGQTLGDLLGACWFAWPLPVWAKWVEWTENTDTGLLEPRTGGMAVVNRAYARRYGTDAPVADGSLLGSVIGHRYSLPDIPEAYREAGDDFWQRLGEDPREPGLIRSVARDRNGVIRLVTGMTVDEYLPAGAGA